MNGLYELLGDEDRKLSFDELMGVLYRLREDRMDSYYKEYKKGNANNILLITFSAEAGAFSVCLDLLKKFDKNKKNC